MSSSPPTSLLRGFPAARTLSPANQARLEDVLERREYKAGEVLYQQGEAAGELLLVVKGRLEVSSCVGSRRVILGLVVAGEVVGEMGVLDDAPRSAMVTAMEPVEVLALSRTQYEALAGGGDPLAHWFLKLISEGVVRRVRFMTRRIAEARIDASLLHDLPADPEERARKWWQVLFRKKED